MKVIMGKLKEWYEDCSAVAAVEAAFVFPILLIMLVGVFDIGNAIIINQKTIRASQVTADLISRNREVDDLIVGEAIAAGRLAYEPITPTSYGVDVVSIRFDQAGTPSIVWRETQGMSPMSNVLTDVAALSAPDSGVLVVGVEYNYQPFFAGFMVSDIAMHEKAFARGRQSAVVCRQGMPC